MTSFCLSCLKDLLSISMFWGFVWLTLILRSMRYEGNIYIHIYIYIYIFKLTKHTVVLFNAIFLLRVFIFM